MKKTWHLLSTAALAWTFAAPAAAVTVFEDDFNRSGGNTVGNGWIELERTPSDVTIDGSQYLALTDARAGSPDASATQVSIDATGYDNLTLSFSWAVFNNDSDAADYLYVDARVGGSSTWSNLGSFSLGGTELVFSEFSTLLAWTDTLLDLRFWTDVSGGSGGSNSEGALIDWVRLSGDRLISTANTPVAVLAIPEPGSLTLALLGVGMLGLGALRRTPALARR